MGRTITIRLTGLAEKFIMEMEREGLNEADVISQGLGLLEEVWRTERVALVKKDFKDNNNLDKSINEGIVLEHYFHVQTPKSMRRETLNDIR